MMFNNLGKISYKENTSQKKIDLDSIKDGINFSDEFIIYKCNKDLNIMIEFVIIIVEINFKNNKTFCPMHNWEFFQKRLLYKWFKKKKKQFQIINNKIHVLEKNLNHI